MIVIAVKYSVKPGLRNKLMEIARKNVEETRKEHGNIDYAHYPSMENDRDMFVFEVWESYKDVEAHIYAPHYLDFSEKRRPMLVENSYEYTVYESQPIEQGKKIKSW